MAYNLPNIVHISTLITIMEAVALLASAISGFIEARKKRLDAISTFIVGFASAFGGGTIRDVLLDRRPFYWVAHENYAILIFCMALIAPMVIRISSKLINQQIFVTVDAIGLGLFTISGTSIALMMGSPPFAATLLGVVSAVFGGVVRDILLNQIPNVLRDNKPYATCAFIGAWVYVLLNYYEVTESISLFISSASIFVLRMLAWWLNIKLPRY